MSSEEAKEIRNKLTEKQYNQMISDLKYANEVIFKNYFDAPEAPKFAQTLVGDSSNKNLQLAKFRTDKTYNQFLMDDKYAESISHHLKPTPKGRSNIENYIYEAKLKEFKDVFGLDFNEYKKIINELDIFKKNKNFQVLTEPELRISQIDSKDDEAENRIEKIAQSKVLLMKPSTVEEAWDKINETRELIERNPQKYLEKKVVINPNVHDLELILTNQEAFTNAMNAIKKCYDRLELASPIMTDKSFSQTMNNQYAVAEIIKMFEQKEGKKSEFEELQERVQFRESVTNKIDTIRSKFLEQPCNNKNKMDY